MPRYFITTTTDQLHAEDEEGVVVPGLAALERLLRRTVALIAHDEGENGRATLVSAVAVDSAGARVMSATLGLTVTTP